MLLFRGVNWDEIIGRLEHKFLPINYRAGDSDILLIRMLRNLSKAKSTSESFTSALKICFIVWTPCSTVPFDCGLEVCDSEFENFFSVLLLNGILSTNTASGIPYHPNIIFITLIVVSCSSFIFDGNYFRILGKVINQQKLVLIIVNEIVYTDFLPWSHFFASCSVVLFIPGQYIRICMIKPWVYTF